MEHTFEARCRTCYGAIMKYCIKIQGLPDPSFGYQRPEPIGFKTPDGKDYVMQVVYTDDLEKSFDRNITDNEFIQSRINDYISYWNATLAFIVNVEMASQTLPHPEYFATPLQFQIDPTTGMAYITGLQALPHRIGLEWSYLS